MLIFLVPLKSKQVSKDWARVSRLLERCVRSIVNQTSEEFKLIIICHERPDISFEHPAIDYLEVDFPPPNLGQKNTINLMDKDKNEKMWQGIEYVSSTNPSHIMFVDADDCVSSQIADFVRHNPHHHGWFLNNGYVYEDGSNRIFYKLDRFHMMSGTSHIIKYSLLKNIDISSLYTNSDSPLHQKIVDIMASRGTPLSPLPFAGATYIIDNGENIYAGENEYSNNQENLGTKRSIFVDCRDLILSYSRRVRVIAGTRPLDETIASEFSLKTPSLN